MRHGIGDEALRREQDFARRLVDTAQAIILVLDNDGRIVSFNPYWEKLSGYALEDVRGRDWIDLFLSEEDRAAVRQILGQALSGVATRGYTNRILTRDGGVRRIEWWDTTLKDAAGDTVGLLSVGHDVTERVAAEERLRASEKKYRQLVELAREGIWAVDAEGKTTFVNPRMAELLGGTVDDLSGVSMFDFMDEHGREISRQSLDRRRQGLQDRHDLELIRRDGKRLYTSWVAGPITDEDGRYVGALAVVSDVTEQRQLQSRFIAAQKMETIAQLAGGVAHQFNNALAVVLSYAGRAKRTLPAGHAARADLEAVLDSSQQMVKLTQQLLAFSRRQMIEPAPLNLSDLVGALEDVLGALVHDPVERVMRLAPDLGWVQADRGRLEQVVLNLATNARDAMPDGGRLTLETANVTLDDTGDLPAGDLPAGDYVRLAVSDTGVGMSAEVQAHLFEPFFTTKDVGEGTGLALAAAYGIVRQHGGDLRVVSAPGQGARFEVYLPRLPAG